MASADRIISSIVRLIVPPQTPSLRAIPQRPFANPRVALHPARLEFATFNSEVNFDLAPIDKKRTSSYLKSCHFGSSRISSCAAELAPPIAKARCGHDRYSTSAACKGFAWS
jgi:hypothetical protein